MVHAVSGDKIKNHDSKVTERLPIRKKQKRLTAEKL